jgi:hypothetical protein
MRKVAQEIREWNARARKARKPHLYVDIEGLVEARRKPTYMNVPSRLRGRAKAISEEWS